MHDSEDIKRALSGHKVELRKNFKVKSIGVFGSYVRGEQRGGSDVDVFVEFEEPVGLFEFMRLENYLSDLLGVKVDLVSKKALKPHIGERLLEEVIMIKKKKKVVCFCLFICVCVALVRLLRRLRLLLLRLLRCRLLFPSLIRY
jgi:predicted nucleotidyltransferase